MKNLAALILLITFFMNSYAETKEKQFISIKDILTLYKTAKYCEENNLKDTGCFGSQSLLASHMVSFFSVIPELCGAEDKGTFTKYTCKNNVSFCLNKNFSKDTFLFYVNSYLNTAIKGNKDERESKTENIPASAAMILVLKNVYKCNIPFFRQD